MQPLVSRLALSALGLTLMSGANAATTVTGQINSTLILISSCQVNGGTGSSGLNFGNLNFGTTNTLFTEADTQLLAGGGGAVSILCSVGTSPTVSIGAGTNDGKSPGGTRALTDGNSNYVPYDLYSDSAHSNLLAINAPINLGTSTGATPLTMNVYGKAVGKPGLPAGTYTDTITVSLSF